MADFYFGTIQALGCNYAPIDWALCAGQQMSVSQNPALFSLIGTGFGGDGRTTFNLPNLQGRVAIGVSPAYDLGDTVGSETTTMLMQTLPIHTHGVAGGGGSLMVSDQLGTTATPTATVNTLGVVNDGNGTNYNLFLSAGLNATINTGGGSAVSGTTTVTGSMPPTPFSILQPVQAFTYAICTNGLYPSFD